MSLRLCMSNIFGPDAHRTADFAFLHGFSGIDWTPDPHEPEEGFLARMDGLCGLEVRLHCRFTGVDMARPLEEGVKALDLHLRWAERAALAGIRQMTVHLGLGNGTGEGLFFQDGARNLKRLVQEAADRGVTVSLENLVSPFSGDPFIFNALVAVSGCAVTFDIGHAHTWSLLHPAVRCRDYVAPCRQRVVSAHIHHAQLEGVGHVPPPSMDVLAERLDLLLEIPSCRWWVIDIQDPEALIRSREMVEEHLSQAICLPSSTGLLLPQRSNFCRQD